MTSFDQLRALADTVMREGQVLYPYRASSGKNQYRWIFGVAMPPAWSATSGEPYEMVGVIDLDATPETSVEVEVRFLVPRSRRVHALVDGVETPVDQLEVDGDLLVSFDDADVCTATLAVGPGDGRAGTTVVRPADDLVEPVADRRGVVHGSLHHHAAETTIVVTATSTAGRLTVSVRNDTDAAKPADRDAATMTAACGIHALLAVTDGAFRPGAPEPAGPLWPSLAGPPGSTSQALLTPMILPDHGHVAPESPGQFHDGTEIDELLALRIRTLTPGEAREAVATDPWAAAAIERAGALDAADMARLHGARRHTTEHVIGGSVTLRPKHRTDSFDVALAGRRATVRDIRSDQDGTVFVGVTVDDDPAADLHLDHGRLFWFKTDELER